MKAPQKIKNVGLIKLAIQRAAEKRTKMAMFHSQVLLHAEILEHLDPVEFCRDVDVPDTYHIEFRKMVATAHMLSELGYSIQKR